MALSLLIAARDSPDQLALVVGEASFTFAGLAVLVERRMAQLHRVGAAPPGTPVAVVGGNDLQTLVSLYALFALEVPVLLLHPRWTEVERQRALAGSGAAWLVAGETICETICETAGESRPTTLAGIAAVVYTSGSTGTPRGAMLTSAAFEASAAASASNLGWQGDDRWLLALPLAHVGGLSIVTRCLLGRRAVVMDVDPRFEPARFAATLAHHRVTLASLVPTMLYRLFRLEPRWSPPASLRALLLGGAAAAGPLLAEAAQRGVPVLTTYGATETCSQVSCQQPGTRPGSEEGAGKPLPGIEVRIVAGEIQVRSRTLFSGYFPPGSGPPPCTADGFFPTGDLGLLDASGHLHVAGRLSERIVSGGENVDPAEVERVLTGHPDVREACVVGLDDPEWGEIVAALLVPGPTGPPPEVVFSLFLRSQLAPFKRPRRIAWVAALPTLPSGKVDRIACARSEAFDSSKYRPS